MSDMSEVEFIVISGRGDSAHFYYEDDALAEVARIRTLPLTARQVERGMVEQTAYLFQRRRNIP